MAVIEYRKGDHPGGFIGFRVTRTVGVTNDWRQAYFGLSDFSHPTAYRLAHELHARWEAEAEQVRKQNRVLNRGPFRRGETSVACGLTIHAGVERKWRAGERRAYPVFGFAVRRGRGVGAQVFRISTQGYDGAWDAAVSAYVKRHELDAEETALLRRQKPSPKQFAAVAVRRLEHQGLVLALDDVLDRLTGRASATRS